MKGIVHKGCITFLGVSMSLFHLYTAGFRPFPALQQRAIHLTFALMLTFLVFPLRKSVQENKSKSSGLFDLLLICLSLFGGAYTLLGYTGIAARTGSPNFWDCLTSVFAILLVIEATRRIMGMTMCCIIFIAFAYAVFGVYLPPELAHSGYSFERIVSHMFLSTDGILGIPLGISATVIAVFLIFGAFLEHSGGTLSFANIGYGLFGRFKGGSAKAAVLGSYLFGMMTGSQTANVAAVGTITIPLMVKGGYPPMVAGAIEALASTGSMLTPPVMGAAAFIIPEFIGGSYTDVLRAATLPGLLFYAAVFAFIHIQASKLGISAVSKEELPNVFFWLKKSAHLFIPILVMLYLIIIEGSSTKKGGFWAVITLVVISMLRKSSRMTLPKIIAALESGAKNVLIVAMACASAGLIEGVISLTGMGLRFSEALIYFAGGNTMLLLLLTMIASLVIGLALPPVTAYLILAILAAPALIKTGLDPMAAHLFILFFGILGNITPPAAPCSFAAAGIAKTDPLKTTNLTFFVSIPTYIIPYMVIYSPELMLRGPLEMIMFRILTAVLGICGIAMVLLGFCFRDLKWSPRVLMFFSSIALVYDSTMVNLIGIFFMVLIFLWQKYVASPDLEFRKNK